MSATADSPTNKIAQPKKPSKPKSHPPYADMIDAAIASLKERKGSSRQAITKYLLANYHFDSEDKIDFYVKAALKAGSKSGRYVHTKGVGATGSFQLAKKEAPAAKLKPKAKPKKASPKKSKSPSAARKPKSPAAAKKPAVKSPDPDAAKSPVAKKPKSPKAMKKPMAAKKKTAAAVPEEAAASSGPDSPPPPKASKAKVPMASKKAAAAAVAVTEPAVSKKTKKTPPAKASKGKAKK